MFAHLYENSTDGHSTEMENDTMTYDPRSYMIILSSLFAINMQKSIWCMDIYRRSFMDIKFWPQPYGLEKKFRLDIIDSGRRYSAPVTFSILISVQHASLSSRCNAFYGSLSPCLHEAQSRSPLALHLDLFLPPTAPTSIPVKSELSLPPSFSK